MLDQHGKGLEYYYIILRSALVAINYKLKVAASAKMENEGAGYIMSALHRRGKILKKQFNINNVRSGTHNTPYIDPLPCVGGLVTSHTMPINSDTDTQIVASVVR